MFSEFKLLNGKITMDEKCRGSDFFPDLCTGCVYPWLSLLTVLYLAVGGAATPTHRPTDGRTLLTAALANTNPRTQLSIDARCPHFIPKQRRSHIFFVFQPFMRILAYTKIIDDRPNINIRKYDYVYWKHQNWIFF